MTCGHCVKAVTEAVLGIEGVETVDVELAEDGPSAVTVVSAGQLDTDAVSAAVAEAGYEVVNV
jgi:copper chaperone CopZ